MLSKLQYGPVQYRMHISGKGKICKNVHEQLWPPNGILQTEVIIIIIPVYIDNHTTIAISVKVITIVMFSRL